MPDTNTTCTASDPCKATGRPAANAQRGNRLGLTRGQRVPAAASARAGWDELDQAAFHVRSALGISPQAWGQARIMRGQEEAITALAAICARHAAGKVRSPGGLRLDRTLFGLADKVRKEADAAGVSRPGQA